MANQYIRTGAGDEKYYYKDIGETILHREDGPAYEASSSSYQEWWLNNKIHRIDGPAVEQASGGKLWLQNSKLHRLDGPATENDDGSKQWFVNGEFIFALSSKGELVNRMK